jgi:hypothetical protein
VTGKCKLLRAGLFSVNREVTMLHENENVVQEAERRRIDN